MLLNMTKAVKKSKLLLDAELCSVRLGILFNKIPFSKFF